jgi:hypothetical protein
VRKNNGSDRDSNPGPLNLQSDDLPTELYNHPISISAEGYDCIEKESGRWQGLKKIVSDMHVI